jgi:uncharacterized protein YndB with AHSA1/START domain
MSTSEIHDKGFSVTTEFAATPDQLYAAWTDPSILSRWLFPECEIDARVGGRYTLRLQVPDVGEVSARGEYLELEPGRKIVQTWESWGPEGRMADGDAVVTVEFRDLGHGSTAMTQSETSETYADRERIDMSLNGTLEAHKALANALEA